MAFTFRPKTPPISLFVPRGTKGVSAAMASSIAKVTEPKLPPPGAAGLGLAREVNKAPQRGALIDTTRSTAPWAGGVGFKGGTITQGPVIVKHTGLNEPTKGATSDNPARFALAPDARHEMLFRRLPDLGGHAPWQGIKQRISGRPGGLGKDVKPINAGINTRAAYEFVNGSKSIGTQAQRLQLQAARRLVKPTVTLRRGLSGLDVAMGDRIVPDTPSGTRSAVIDRHPAVLHPSGMKITSAPASVLANMNAATAKAASAPQSNNDPVSIPSSASVVAAATGQPVSSAPSDGSGLNIGLIAVVGVALLLLTR